MIKGKISLKIVSKDFEYSKDCMPLNRKNTNYSTCNELENDMIAQDRCYWEMKRFVLLFS